MEKKYQEFYNDLKDLISDFQKAKNKYSNKDITLKLLSVIFATMATIFISLTFIENLEMFFKILSIISSGLASIFIAVDKITNYKEKANQRTITFVKLQEIKRLYKINVLYNADSQEKMNQFNKLVELENKILKEDLDIWKEATKIDESIK
ncbi:MAG: SLATT domain-containing protein [Clostridia bacterium]|nr:SLATT domain-containing protein [Clostridia bacterium]